MADAVREIEQFLAAYYAAFASGAYHRIASEMIHAPAVLTTGERVDVLATSGEVEKMFQTMGAALVADGYASSELLASEITVLNDLTALAATRFRRLRHDGSEIINAGATYWLLYEAGRWKISAATVHAGDRMVAVAGD